jgi:CHAD domain-containing protein
MSSTPRNGRHPTTIRPLVPVTTALLLRRARALERHLPAALAGEDAGVHQARVASRRLREAVPVLAAGVKRASKASRKIRQVTRALGTVREMDVTRQVLDELARRPEIPRNALEDVRAHVLAERDRRRAVMHARLRKLNTAKLSRRLNELAVDLTASVTGAWRETLASRVGVRAKRLAAAIKAAGQMYDPERLHQVRIATKKLRYTLELAADSHSAAARPLVATLKRTQEALGRLHDLQVIQGHVADVQVRPPQRRGAGDGGLDVITVTLEKECRHLHARYAKQIPALIELADTCRSTILVQIGEPDSPPTPPRSPRSPRSPRLSRPSDKRP